MYSLPEKELEMLKKYLDINLKKGFIQFSILSAEYSIIFMLKANKKL